MPSLISARTGIFFRFAKRQGNITELGTHMLPKTPTQNP
jgi:hypothetical protein